jgi:ABC-2 type transport system permease protein
MRIIHLAIKDLQQILRDKKALLFLIAMPIVFTFFMGIAFKGAASTPDMRLPVAWINTGDQGFAADRLHTALLNSDSINLVEMDAGEIAKANQQVNAGSLAAALIIPADFSSQVLTSQHADLTLILDENATPGQSALQAVQAHMVRLMGAAEAARITLNLLDLSSPDARQAEFLAAFEAANQVWDKTDQEGLQVITEKATGQAAPTAALGGNPYNQTSPGILVQFAIFGLVTSANILVQERKTGTLDRLVTTSMKRSAIIAGHLIAMFALIMLQEIILILFGQFVLGVDYFRQPLGILLVMTGLALWIACLGLLISVVSKAEEQVILYSLICMFVFSALGGAWFPLEGSGPAFAALGQVMPSAWAMNGFQNILIRGLSSGSALLPTGILLAYALLCFAAAVWRFRKA